MGLSYLIFCTAAARVTIQKCELEPGPVLLKALVWLRLPRTNARFWCGVSSTCLPSLMLRLYFPLFSLLMWAVTLLIFHPGSCLQRQKY